MEQRLSAGVVVVRESVDGARFLLLRAYRNWDFPKGLVEPGEDPLAAAVREVHEETGLTDLAFEWGTGFIETERVFAAHAALRAAITPGGRGAGARTRAVAPEPPTPKDVRLNWARRLKRVFGIEIERCARCGGRLKVIASIEEPEVIERILAHRRERGEEAAPAASLGARAPPQTSLF